MNTYSESFSIPASGWTGGASAIMVATTGTAPVTMTVRLWRDEPTSAARTIALLPGIVYPLKVRNVTHSSTVTGFN